HPGCPRRQPPVRRPQGRPRGRETRAPARGGSRSFPPPPCRSRWPWPRACPTSCPTSGSPPRSTAAPTWRPKPPRCARTPRRSSWTPAGSPCPAGAGSRSAGVSSSPCSPGPPARAPAPWSTTCSPGWTGGDQGGGKVVSGHAFSLLCVDGGQARQRREIGTVAAYAALFVLGALEGLIGSFHFAHSLGRVPVASLAFCVL